MNNIKEPIVEEEVRVKLYKGTKWFRKVYEDHTHCFHKVDRYSDKSAMVITRQCCRCGYFERCEAISSKHGDYAGSLPSGIKLRPEDIDTYTPWTPWTPYSGWY